MSPCEQASVWREGQSKVNWARVKRKVSSQKKQRGNSGKMETYSLDRRMEASRDTPKAVTMGSRK